MFPSPFHVPVHHQGGYLLCAPNLMYPNDCPVAQNQLRYVCYGYPEPFHWNGHENQPKVYGMPLPSRIDQSNMPAIPTNGPPMYLPGAAPNGGLTSAPCHFYPADQGLAMSAAAAPCHTLSPESYYVPPSRVPAIETKYHLSGHLSAGKQRQWSGDLPEFEIVSHYLCRFEVDQTKFQVIEDLKFLFRSNIDVITDDPLNNSCTPYLFAYIKACNWLEFQTNCHFAYPHPNLANFQHPTKKYLLKVVIKPFKLPECLYYGRQPSHRYQENQLYVDGLARMFSAADIYKIYQDLYKKNVVAVRVFSDKSGYPKQGALVQFSNRETYLKALQESPIMVCTSMLTIYLHNKVYERLHNKQFNGNHHNRGTSWSTRQQSRDENGANQVAQTNVRQQYSCDNSSAHLKQSLERSATGAGRHQWKNKRVLLSIRQNARRNSNSGRYTQMMRELTVYKRLKHYNYLSD